MTCWCTSDYRRAGVSRVPGGNAAQSALLAAHLPDARHPAPRELLVSQTARVVLLRPMPAALRKARRRRGTLQTSYPPPLCRRSSPVCGL